MTLGFEVSGADGMLGAIEYSASSVGGLLFFFFAIAMNVYMYSQRGKERSKMSFCFHDMLSQIFLFSDDEPKPRPLLIGWTFTCK